jgi:hypothetical protein
MLPSLTQITAEEHRQDLLRDAEGYRRSHPKTSVESGSEPYRRTHLSGARLRSALAIALTAVCGLALIGVAAANALSPRTIVGPHGKVAGEGYGQWLRISFQRTVSETPSASVCQSERVNGTLVALLLGGYSGKPERHSCRIPARTPIYVNGLFAECSTVEQPPFHATTPAGLQRCARHNFQGATNLAATVDSQPVRGYRTLISASPVYTFHLPKHNLLGVTARSGRSASYGEGLLLLGLGAGTHTIHITGDVPGAGFAYDVTYTLNVTP